LSAGGPPLLERGTKANEIEKFRKFPNKRRTQKKGTFEGLGRFIEARGKLTSGIWKKTAKRGAKKPEKKKRLPQGKEAPGGSEGGKLTILIDIEQR